MLIRNKYLTPPRVMVYGLGTGLPGLAFLLVLLSGPLIQPNIFPVFLPAVFLCAWHAGWRSALLCTGLSTAAIYYLLAAYAGHPAASLYVRISLFLAVSLGLSWLAVLLKREKMIMNLLQRLSGRLLRETSDAAILKEILSACLASLGAPRGYAQVYDGPNQVLRTVSSAGRGGDLAAPPEESKDSDSVSARALAGKERVITAEAQATPLCGRKGQLIGMITTRFGRSRRLSRQELKLLDLFARMAEQMLERAGGEEALRQSEERFRLMVESVHDYAIFMLDSRGLVVSWNQGAERIKGYDAGEILGRNFSVFYTEDERKAGRPEEELRLAAVNGRLEAESLAMLHCFVLEQEKFVR
jgi:PAS domain-containing protein